MEHMGSTPLSEWAATITGDDSLNAISRASGVVVSTLSRQWPDKLSATSVVKIARGYEASALDGLIAQGLLTPHDIETTVTLDALQNATDEQLLGEIARRLKTSPLAHPVLTEPLDNVTNSPSMWGSS